MTPAPDGPVNQLEYEKVASNHVAQRNLIRNSIHKDRDVQEFKIRHWI